MTTGFLITARMKSTRLPRKLTLDLLGKRVIDWQIERVKQTTRIDRIVVCTSINPQDDILETIAHDHAVECFRGSEDDVLLRLMEAAKANQCDYVVNITADCPLVSPEWIDNTVDEFRQTNADFIRALDLPHGFFSYGLKPAALRQACELKRDQNTEVWGRYFTDSGAFQVVDLAVPTHLQRPDFRLTLDYPEDYEFFHQVFSHYGEEIVRREVAEIITYLDAHPEVVSINAHCAAAYQKRWNLQNRLNL